MHDNERIFVENKFLANAIEKLITAFIDGMPPPKMHRNQADYSPLIEVMRKRKKYLIKASNYLHETKSFNTYFDNRLEFERTVHKSKSGLANKQTMSQAEQLCVACWFNVIMALDIISKNFKDESIHAAKAKELSYMCAIVPVFAQHLTALEG